MPIDPDLQALISRIHDRCKSAMPFMLNPGYASGGAVSDQAAQRLIQAFDFLDQARAALEAGEAKAAIALSDSRFMPDERRRQWTTALSEASAAAEALYDQAEERLATTRADLERAVLPGRPGTADATQEARLTNMRADLRMVLDPVPKEELVSAMADTLGRFVDDGDRLGIWLMAGSSSWSGLYLRSRFSDPMEADYQEASYRQAAATVLNPAMPDDARTAAHLLNLWERNGQNDYRLGQLIFIARQAGRMLLDDLGAVSTQPGAIAPSGAGNG